MKCCSRSTLGVVIGTLSIVCNIIAIIYFIHQFHFSENNTRHIINHGDNIYEYRYREFILKVKNTH